MSYVIQGAHPLKNCRKMEENFKSGEPETNPPLGETYDRLLDRLSQGDAGAPGELLELLYDDLHRIASRQLRGERSSHTWGTTDLLHECYPRLLPQLLKSPPESRKAFLGIAKKVMQNLLIDYARKHSRRPQGHVAGASFDVMLELLESQANARVTELHQALELLQVMDERQYDIVVLRFFYGMDREELAALLGCSVSTVDQDWRFARAWLRDQLRPEADHEDNDNQ